MNNEKELLPVVNIFNDKVYKEKEIVISNTDEAIQHIANNSAVPGLQMFMDQQIESSDEIQKWYKSMPEKPSKQFESYQKTNKFNSEKLSSEIEKVDCCLPKGQKLYHGGFLTDDNLVTTRPLSTTLNPHVAFSETWNNNKANREGAVYINELEISNEAIKAFIYGPECCNPQEQEVLLTSNIKITVMEKNKITDKYPTFIGEMPDKNVPVYHVKAHITTVEKDKK